MCEFFNRWVNRRQDAYGEHGERFAVEILRAIRERVPEDFVVGIRLGGFEPRLEDGIRHARILEKERTYLLVKIFALAGIRVGELPQVTVERVRAGRLPVRTGGERRYVPLPACLQGELLDYARRQGLTAGPVFCTRNGKGMSRTQVTEEIQTLCHDARVEEEKGTPRCLRKLYLATQAEVERGVRLLAEQSYERMLDTEQLAAGWAEGTGHSIHKDVYI